MSGLTERLNAKYVSKIGLMSYGSYKRHKKRIPPNNYVSWWLRTPGTGTNTVYCVLWDGNVVSRDACDSAGIRPILTYTNRRNPLVIGQKYAFGDITWIAISQSQLISDDYIFIAPFSYDGPEFSNDYEKSDVKIFLDAVLPDLVFQERLKVVGAL